MRLIIAGGPKRGKTTLAHQIGDSCDIPIYSTDSLIASHDWSAASYEVMKWFSRPDEWIIEGVAVPRAIRKWFRDKSAAPCDVAIWIPEPVAHCTNQQAEMARRCKAVWFRVLPSLRLRKVEILTLY